MGLGLAKDNLETMLFFNRSLKLSFFFVFSDDCFFRRDDRRRGRGLGRISRSRSTLYLRTNESAAHRIQAQAHESSREYSENKDH